jgi:hypothetical protein
MKHLALAAALVAALPAAAVADARDGARFIRPAAPVAPVIVAPAPAVFCASRAEIAARLAGEYSEALAGGGMQGPQGFVEVWTSVGGGTWSLLMTRPDGSSCVIATGMQWQVILPPAGDPT